MPEKTAVPNAGASPRNRISVNNRLPANAPEEIVVTLAGIVMLVSERHSLKAAIPIVSMLSPRVMEVALIQSSNAESPMIRTSSPMVILSKPLHAKKALFSIALTLSGIVTEVSRAHPAKASKAIIVTGLPSIMSGMARGPVAAVLQSVMVTVSPEAS